MSSDNGLLLNLKTFRVSYYQGDGEIQSWECKTLEEAIRKVQEIDKEYGGVEYGCQFIGKLTALNDDTYKRGYMDGYEAKEFQK